MSGNKRLKSWKDKLVEPYARFFVFFHIPPWVVSVLSLIFAFWAVIVVVQSNNQPLFGVLAFVSIAADGIDGSVARLSKSTSAKGRFLDQVFDRFADAIVLIGVILAGAVNVVIGLVALSASLIASYVSEAGELNLKESKSQMTAEGLSLRWFRWLILVVGGLLSQLHVAVTVIAVLALYAVVARFAAFYKVLK
ncbi:MAG: CDP-alcohol phosphatidyltransferase family protein [Candidatus Diapherotrites archaeon]|nr:CDP-alcohol phosphatidyltransferase family protein [Candidatus Diapherotrites archaeon]